MVPTAQHELTFSIEGNGEIVATDNGDASDLTAFGSKKRKAFNGMALVIVRSKKNEKGTVKLTVSCDSLEMVSIQIISK